MGIFSQIDLESIEGSVLPDNTLCTIELRINAANTRTK